MANKNTLRTRRALEKTRKRGYAVNSNNQNRFSPSLDKESQELVEDIRRQTRKLYGAG